MRPSTHRKALAATARVACAAAVFTGCQGKQRAAGTPPVVDVQPTDSSIASSSADTAAPGQSNAAEAAAPSQSGAAEAAPSAKAVVMDAALESCSKMVNTARAGGTALPPGGLAADVKACCQKIATHHDAARTAWTGDQRHYCCSGLGWMGSTACTPWGPPTPPAMPAWLVT